MTKLKALTLTSTTTYLYIINDNNIHTTLKT